MPTRTSLPKHPSEIFGFPVEDRSVDAQAARSRRWCPFMDKRCDKKSRLISYPFGVCSAQWSNEIIALCPHRFLQKEIVFKDVADHHFGARHDLLVFPEVGLSSVGSFDYVIVKHKSLSSDVEDFVVVEFQTGQTTSTGKLVQAMKDFMHGQDVRGRSYKFGLNQYDIWKRTFTQVLNKGMVLEKWGQKIFWVVQEPIYQYFTNRYGLGKLGYSANDCTSFVVYDMPRIGSEYQLSKTRIESADVDGLLRAFREAGRVPKKDAFLNVLRRKMRARVYLDLDLAK
jgi:hypothetical protein